MLILLGLAGVVNSVNAEVYTWVDEQGLRIYSDKPNPTAEIVEVKSLPTYQAPKTAPQSNAEAKEKVEITFTQYDVLVLKTPEQDEIIRSNQGNITVIATVHPDLQDDHQLQLMMDGKPVLEAGKQTGWQLNNVNRGEHQLQVLVLDEAGQTFQTSDSVTVHLKRHSILLPNPKLKQ